LNVRSTAVLIAASALAGVAACSSSPGEESGFEEPGFQGPGSEEPGFVSSSEHLDASTEIVSVRASSDDGNVPQNVLDGNLSTRWSASGRGSWIEADLGQARTVDTVQIAWHQGDRRTNNFTIGVSQDAVSFTQVHSGVSSGQTLNLESYTFPAVSARYVKVTVNGNSVNDWASVTELRVPGGGTPPPPPPPPPTGSDPFGIPFIYPSKSGGEAWYLGTDPTHDPRFNPQTTITRNADGSWKVKNNQVRMQVYTSTGYDSSRIQTYDPDVLAANGYMQAANDWRNIEMTGFVKLNATSDLSDNFSWYARGGRHTDSLACEGSSYKGGLHFDGRARWEKESWHVSYDQAAYRTVTSSLRGRWVGFKAVMRNVTVNGATAVKLEMYLNDNADKVTWTKFYDMTDSGGWGGDASYCGGSVDAAPITWGGPIAAFRWDNASDVDFKWMSVREVQ
jgi:F5/8 type C domain-containing protein